MFGVISIYSLNYLHLVIEAIIVVISYFILKRVTKEEFFSFIGHSLLYFIYIFKHFEQVNDGVVTILLVFYVLGFLTYFVSLGKEKHVQTTLVMIIIVAIKMILIDLQSVAVIWKIITTMIFGAYLLGLSYFLNPIIERNKNEKSS
jgi:uncharacterized membrane protein